MSQSAAAARMPPRVRGRSREFGFIGESEALGQVLDSVAAVAPTESSVLIIGESGVGKELVARAVHQQSKRRSRDLVRVNCAALPDDLFESELFGHVKGAFSGAYRDRIGRFQKADRGTLFLDEVGEIPYRLQSKLLRVVEQREFERVGDDRTRQVDVRLIAATNQDLGARVSSGHFRQDLLFRLGVFPIEVPPLRRRRQDVVPLAEHFLRVLGRQHGKPGSFLRKRQKRALVDYNWPGNVRELRNVIERALILSRDGELDIEGLLFSDTLGPTPRLFVTETEWKRRERRNLIAALEFADWRISGPGGAAELLGMKPTTLSSRLKAYGIARPPA